MPFDPDKFISETAPGTTSFDPDKFLVDTDPGGRTHDSEVGEAPPAVAAATTGLANGAAPFGLAGALAGVGKTAMDAITGTRGPLAGAPLSDLVQDYRDSRDSFSNDSQAAAEAHPYVSAAGNVAGAAVPLTLSPVGSFIKNKLAGEAAPVVERSASWAREGLSGALEEESRRAVANAIAKKLAWKAAKAALATGAAGAGLKAIGH